jgi:hypothetical protein
MSLKSRVVLFVVAALAAVSMSGCVVDPYAYPAGGYYPASGYGYGYYPAPVAVYPSVTVNGYYGGHYGGGYYGRGYGYHYRRW